MIRKCKDCPTWTQTVCRHAFGVYWCVKSGNGDGCTNPLDGVAEAWRKAGWKNGKDKSIPITLPVTKTPIAHKRNNYVQETMLFSSVRGDPSPRHALPPLSDDDY